MRMAGWSAQMYSAFVGVIAVSYTHLDVYKRQVTKWEQSAAHSILARSYNSNNCLLYTSHARIELGRGGHHGGERERTADVDAAEYCGGVGVYAAGRGPAVGHAVLFV